MKPARKSSGNRPQVNAARKAKGMAMPEETARPEADKPVPGVDLDDLRAAVADLAHKVRAYGLDRFEALRDEVEEDADSLVHAGRRRAHDLQARVAKAEAKVERHVREHPLTWVGGVLGVIGFGLALGMVLRRKD